MRATSPGAVRGTKITSPDERATPSPPAAMALTSTSASSLPLTGVRPGALLAATRRPPARHRCPTRR
jgi:hypothetical protein